MRTKPMLRRPGWTRRGRFDLPLAGRYCGPFGVVDLADPRWGSYSPHRRNALATLEKMHARYRRLLLHYPVGCDPCITLEYIRMQIALLGREIDYRHKRRHCDCPA